MNNDFLAIFLTFEFRSSIIGIVIAILYATRSDTNTSKQTDHAVFKGKLHVTSENFNDTLLNKYSQYYKEKEKKYGNMVS